MLQVKKHKAWTVVTVGFVILGLAALLGTAACGDVQESTVAKDSAPTTAAPAMTSTTWAASATTMAAPAAYLEDDGYYSGEAGGGIDQAVAGTLTALQAASGQKIISSAHLEIEVEQGKFQMVFDQAMMLAARYGGYLVSSDAYASGEEDSMKSGTVAVRVPSGSFAKALDDATKIGTLKKHQLSTDDVTEEYVDLEARIKNAEANVSSLLALLEKAETVDEILYVRSVLTSAQGELESLKGRMRFLEENTSYSTISMSIYEVGAETLEDEEDWGFIAALKGGLRNLVKAFNAIIRGLGILIPILIVLAIIAYIIYAIVRAIVRRNRAREQARYQAYPEGWRPPATAGMTPAGGPQAAPAAAPAAQPAGQATAEAKPSTGQAPQGEEPREPGKQG